MPVIIFCPSSHLILSAPRCPVCGWERPVPAEIGQFAWPPVTLKAGLGGPGRHVFAQPAAAQGVAALPLNNRQMVGLNLDDGAERWQIDLPEGLVTRALVADGKRLLLTLSDERQIGLAGPGQLASLDPLSGKLSTLWQADGHQLTIPVLTDQYLLLRDSTSGLVAFQRGTQPEVAWKVPLNTWSALPPFVTQGKVFICDGRAMQGEGWLTALDLSARGREVWSKPTEGLLAKPLTACDGKLIFQNGKRQILARDVSTGGEVWNLKFEQIYTPPISGGGRVYCVVRGEAPKGSPGYYLLKALSPANRQTEEWEAPLPNRVLNPLCWDSGRLYLVTEDGQLLAFNDQNGQELFSQTVGEETDPPRTELLLAEGLLLTGTYSGRVLALSVEATRQELEPPEAYLQRNEFEAAAAACALRGDFRQSAGLYANPINDLPKALALYEYAKLYQEAADLCFANQQLSDALRFHGLAGNLLAEAEILLLMQDERGAARKFEQAGKLDRAAELYEDDEVRDFSSALRLYEILGRRADAKRVEDKMPPDISRIRAQMEKLAQEGKFAEAAAEALRGGFFREAADDYNKAGLTEEEYKVLNQLAVEQPEAWLWERIAVRARSSGRFLDEAEALEKFNQYVAEQKLHGQKKFPASALADAYYRAAWQAERLESPDISYMVGELYSKARKLFVDAGNRAMEQKCSQKVTFFWQLPDITLESVPRDAFNEGQFNVLELIVSNQGYGVAKNILIQVDNERFELDHLTYSLQHGNGLELGNLGEGLSDKKPIRVRPKPDQVGPDVPLAVAWKWWDEKGAKYEKELTAGVPVRGKDESRHGNTPQVINIGTLVQGDQVQGDLLRDNAQKGDKVEISHGKERPSVHLTGRGLQMDGPIPRACPRCTLPNDPDAKICNYCGNQL